MKEKPQFLAVLILLIRAIQEGLQVHFLQGRFINPNKPKLMFASIERKKGNGMKGEFKLKTLKMGKY